MEQQDDAQVAPHTEAKQRWALVRTRVSKLFACASSIWEKLDTLGKIVLTALTLISALTSLLVLYFRTDAPVDCLASDLSFDQLQSCMFSRSGETMENAFRENQRGHRLTFKTSFGVDFSAPERSGLYYAVGHWGPAKGNGQSYVATCQRPYAKDRDSDEQRLLLSRLKKDDQVIVTGIIEEISRQRLILRECLIFEQIK